MSAALCRMLERPGVTRGVDEEIIGGKYRLGRRIGAGGMGVVYEATNLSIQRPVALKLMSGRNGHSERDIRRFMREGIAAAATRHRAIVDVYDAGTTPRPWIAMELLEGETLAERVDRTGPIPWSEVVEIGSEILAGLAAVHDQSIIHRDLKPTNVFLHFAEGRLQPKVLDFGVAKLLRLPQGGTPSVLTLSGTPIGTAGYTAPEQILSSTDVDARADLWSFGAVLFEILTGQKPYPPDELPDCVRGIPWRPVRDVRLLAPDVPKPLNNVIAQCLALDRRNRPASANAALVLLMNSHPEASARPRSRPRRS